MRADVADRIIVARVGLFLLDILLWQYGLRLRVQHCDDYVTVQADGRNHTTIHNFLMQFLQQRNRMVIAHEIIVYLTYY